MIWRKRMLSLNEESNNYFGLNWIFPHWNSILMVLFGG